MAEEILAQGRADYVAIARAFMTDPDWAEKARAGRADDIRPCIKCLRCLDVSMGRVNTDSKAVLQDFTKATRRNDCSVNPTYGHTNLMHRFPKPTRRKKVIVVGGGMVGCETALHLTHSGREVVLVEMVDMLAPDGIFTERTHTLDYMDKDPLLIHHVNTKCTEILDNGIKVIGENGEEQFIEADSVVLSVGMKAKEEERDSFRGTAFDVISIGDCLKVGTVYTAVQTGFRAGLRL
jgi:NAD(P)H-nitrite reductase large subunit